MSSLVLAKCGVPTRPSAFLAEAAGSLLRVGENDQMSSSAAATFLGISIATLRRWCDQGKVPYWRTPGGNRRFSRLELAAWLDKRQEGR